MILVIGTPDSGKSAYAEELAVKSGSGKDMAYIATMIPFGVEGEKRIEKHRHLREGKSFITYEEPYKVSSLLNELNEKGIKTALLECVSNLTGNVIHMAENSDKGDDELINDIVADIVMLSDGVRNLYVVANYFEQKHEYDEDTARYIRINNAVNERLKLASESYALKQNGEWTLYDNN